MLSVNNIEVIYKKTITVIKALSLEVPAQNITAILGANGAGKTTTLKSISGLLKADDGEVSKGSIVFEKRRIEKLPASSIVCLGIFQVMEGRQIFEDLSVKENLIIAAHTQKSQKEIRESIAKVYNHFPVLKARSSFLSGFLSGGEQQMLVIGRALMAKPKLMMLDEPSLGLSPLLVEQIFHIISKINKQDRTAVLLVEQNALMALEIASHAYVMENGRMVLDDTSEKLRNHEDIKRFYLGLKEIGDSKSFREVKHYKRRKRWLS